MTCEDRDRFSVSVNFAKVLKILASEIYDTPLAFLRENVQNAVDAVRIQALRDDVSPSDPRYRVSIDVVGDKVTVQDNGIGMSLKEQRELFWSMGKSGKGNREASQAGCIGAFGVGGFANLGVCTSLKVISCQAGTAEATWSSLSRDDLRAVAGDALPTGQKGVAEPKSVDEFRLTRGTVLIAILEEVPETDKLRLYVEDFARFAPEHIYFNGSLVSRHPLRDDPAPAHGLRAIEPSEIDPALFAEPSPWLYFAESVEHGASAKAACTWYVDKELDLFAELQSITPPSSAAPVAASGWLKVALGEIRVLRDGFMICRSSGRDSMSYYGALGLTGSVDCREFSPTAGRDSLIATSENILSDVLRDVVARAAQVILSSSELIGKHSLVLDYCRYASRIDLLGNLRVDLVGNYEAALSEVRSRSTEGIKVYYVVRQDDPVGMALHSSGSVVVRVPNDRTRAGVIRDYLTKFCDAESCDERVEIDQPYDKVSFTRFELLFIDHVSSILEQDYMLREVDLRVGRLTRDVPAFVTETGAEGIPIILVDVRHSEVKKLYSLATVYQSHFIRQFCTMYMSEALKRASARAFGNENLFSLLMQRPERWVLSDREIVVINGSLDVATVNVGEQPPASLSLQPPKLLRLIGYSWLERQSGYYLRLPDRPIKNFNDDIRRCTRLAATWGGSKVSFIAMDEGSMAFSFEIRLPRPISADYRGRPGAPGSIELAEPLYRLYGGCYFPVPSQLTPAFVPPVGESIQILVKHEVIFND